jgi:DNA-binding CsgD family transcriptional regulator
VWEHTRGEGIADPGAFPVAPDLVEALYRVGAAGEAEEVLEVLARAAREQRHPWAGAALTRCRAETSLAEGRDEEALERFQAAAASYRQLGLPFDSARALLAAGAVARSLRRWGTARRLLEDAAAGLTELGCDGWADEASAQLERVAARKPAPAGQLTTAERRVAALAAAGLSNKEIATRLAISVSTVETHLKRCYAKLRVSSRTQLTTALTAVEDLGPS